MQIKTTPSRYSAIVTLFILLIFGSCSNPMDNHDKEFTFPESLTIEKILGITWKADKNNMKVISPADVQHIPDSLMQIYAIKDKLFNSLLLSKTGDVYATYTRERTVFYNEGKWRLNPNDKEELMVKVGSPVGELEFRIKIRKFNLLNNILVMDAYFLHPNYSFSILFSGKGAQEDYWSKETDIIDPSWINRNQISNEPVKYADIVGAYSVNREDWKRVVYIDNLKDNFYPLLDKYQLIFEANGNLQLNRLSVPNFGVNFYTGTWTVNKNKVLLNFPLFPFYGNIHKYSGVFEIDYIPLLEGKHARHNAGIVMEIVKTEQDRILVKFTETGLCSVYVYLNKI